MKPGNNSWRKLTRIRMARSPDKNSMLPWKTSCAELSKKKSIKWLNRESDQLELD